MAAPITQREIELYAEALSEIKYRLDRSRDSLKVVSDLAAFECAVLQLRLSIELVALATLAANAQVVSEVSTTLHTKDWNEARKLLRQNNPGYWPTPFKDNENQYSKRSLEAIGEPYLTEGEAGKAWGYLSELLHANNPFARNEIDQTRVDKVRAIAMKLRNLLGLHTAEIGSRDHVLLAQMDVEPDGHVEVVVLNEISRVTHTVDPRGLTKE